MNGRMARLFAVSMMPLAGSDLAPPAKRLEPPPLTAPASDPTPFVPGPDILTYISAGNALRSPLGAMRLSAHYAAFENLLGHMTLEYAGVLPEFSGYRIASEFLSGALVYRVTNSEQYLLENPTICGGAPPRFMVAKFTSLADIQDGPAVSINLQLLSLDDYRDFRPTAFDPCGGDMYKALKADDALPEFEGLDTLAAPDTSPSPSEAPTF